MINYQKSKTKCQNEKDKFKKEFFKRLVKLSVDTIKFCEELKQSRVMWSVSDRLIRSTTSIGANIVEAKASSSKKEVSKIIGSSVLTLKGKKSF